MKREYFYQFRVNGDTFIPTRLSDVLQHEVNVPMGEGLMQFSHTLRANIVAAAGAGLSKKDTMLIARFIKRNTRKKSDKHKGAELLGSGVGGGSNVYALPETNLAIKIVDADHRYVDVMGPDIYPSNPEELVHMANLGELFRRYGPEDIIVPKVFAIILPREEEVALRIIDGSWIQNGSKTVREASFNNVYLVMEKMDSSSWVYPYRIYEDEGTYTDEEKEWARNASSRVREALEEILKKHVSTDPQDNFSKVRYWLEDFQNSDLLLNVRERKICVIDTYLPIGRHRFPTDWVGTEDISLSTWSRQQPKIDSLTGKPIPRRK